MSSVLVNETSSRVGKPLVPEREIPQALAPFFDRTHWKLFFEAFVPFQYKAFQDRGAFVNDSRATQSFGSESVNREVVAGNAIVLLDHYCSTRPADLDAMRAFGRKLGESDGFDGLLDSSRVYTVSPEQTGSKEQKQCIAKIIGDDKVLASVLERDEIRHHERWLLARMKLEEDAIKLGKPLPPHPGSKPFEQLDDNQRWVSKCQTLMNCVTLARLSGSAFALIKSAAQSSQDSALSTLAVPQKTL